MLIDIIYIYIYIINCHPHHPGNRIRRRWDDGWTFFYSMDSFESCGKRNGMVYGIQDVHHVASTMVPNVVSRMPVMNRSFSRHLSFKKIHAIINQSLYNYHPLF